MPLRLLILMALCLGFMAAPAQEAATGGSGTRVYIGTLGNAILAARLDSKTGELSLLGTAAEITRPSWLAIDPKRPVLYSVSETGNDGKDQGGVYSLAIDPATGALKVISKVASGGGGATYLSYDARVNTVFVANFGGGQVGAIPVQPDGSLSPVSSVQTDTGTGPNPKQNIPHAHGATLDPSGRFLLTPDMGADRVFVRRFDAQAKKLSPADPPFEATPPGSGPRHLVFSPDGRFVFLVTELAAEVRSFRWDAKAGRLQPIQTLPMDKPDFKGVRSAAEIVISKDGRFLYASNRAENTLLVYAVNKKSGTMTQLQEIPCGGQTPRGLGIDPSESWMIVANENSSTLTVFEIDKATGKLTAAGQPLPLALKPVAFAFYPQ